MKIIISHDVDHIYASDHYKDLIFPKLFIRSFLELIQGKIKIITFLNRLLSIFQKRLNRIPELIGFNKKNDIPCIFFFGMDNILGLSYKINDAKPWIKYVLDNGFDVGVHGININNYDKILNEYQEFKKVSKLKSFGTRIHYVRYNETTFKLLSDSGYIFDSSEFNKKEIEIKAPYKIGQMWEFPLYIMDGYVMKNGLIKAKEQTLLALEKANKSEMPYFTILFHDYLFNEKTYPYYKQWYMWIIEYLKLNKYEFISYRDAIIELEEVN